MTGRRPGRPWWDIAANLSRLPQLAIVGIAGAVLAYAASKLVPADYECQSALLLDSGTTLSGLGNVASLVNMVQPTLLGVSGEGQRAYSYIAVAQSRTILERILQSSTPEGNGARLFFEDFAPTSGSPARRMETAVSRLRGHVRGNYSSKTFILTITVGDRHPGHSKAITENLIRYLREFNSATRVSRAREAREFIAQRTLDAGDSLAEAESRLVEFRRENVRIGGSPTLQLTETRLTRRVRICEDAYSLLSQQLEIARIEEKREAPTFSVVDSPQESSRPRRVPGPLALVLGGVCSVGILLLASAVRQALRGD